MSGNCVQGDEMREELPFGQTVSVVNGVATPMVDGTTPPTTGAVCTNDSSSRISSR